MATLREYLETDFGHSLRFHIKISTFAVEKCGKKLTKAIE